MLHKWHDPFSRKPFKRFARSNQKKTWLTFKKIIIIIQLTTQEQLMRTTAELIRWDLHVHELNSWQEANTSDLETPRSSYTKWVIVILHQSTFPSPFNISFSTVPLLLNQTTKMFCVISLNAVTTDINLTTEGKVVL